MAHSQPAQAAVLGSPDTLGHILQFLCNKARWGLALACVTWGITLQGWPWQLGAVSSSLPAGRQNRLARS